MKIPRLWEPNPIVVKELRQAVRSRFVTGVLMLFLFVEVVGAGIVLWNSSLRGMFSISARLEAGRNMFRTLTTILSAATLLFVPIYTGIRLAMERSRSNMDLLYITTIRPNAVVRGKLFAGGVITVLLFAAAMPFMSFTYVLRGIDLPTVSVALAAGMVLVLASIQAAIFLACLPVSIPFRLIVGLGFLGCLFFLLTGFNGAVYGMISFGVGSQIWSWDFWGPATIALGVIATIFGFLHFASVALISPAASNRSLPMRLYVTIAWILWGTAAIWLSFRLGDEFFLPWSVLSVMILSPVLLVAVSENETLSARVRNRIPRSLWVRPFAFLFYNGPAAGILWVAVITAISILTANIIGSAYFPGSHMQEYMEKMGQVSAGVFLYFWAYALTALLLWRLFLKRWLKHSAIWVVALLLMAAVGIVPVLIALAVEENFGDFNNPPFWFYAGNIIGLAQDELRPNLFVIASIWAGSVTLLNAGWFWRQIRLFRPPSDSREQV
ncbi:MAG: hypothetical protein ACOC6C_00055 [Verrucomicrobiota bacterium]